MPSNLSSKKNKVTLSAFEEVVFPELSAKKLKAKMDTGAYTGALHCESIKRKNNVLIFVPYGSAQNVKVSKFAEKHVVSSNGQKQRRFVIDTSIKIRGKKYPIAISLTDRSKMRWPVLIGRRFLRRNNILVDVSSL